MKKYIYSISVALLLTLANFAHEGMWIPSLLHSLQSDMQAQGLKLSVDDIYSINHSSLKDAIVHFGGGCTAELISDQGLLLTNHHCGFSQIQSHSSVERDYLKDGFWAMNRSEELANPGLTATFIVRIEDVTSQILDGVTEDLSETERNKLIIDRSAVVEANATDGNHFQAKVRAFNYGNDYYLIVTETYKDVRLVGAPPSSIGKFGGDTDNWIWPRHTGDFSIFRIYSGTDNSPAEYSEDNIPFKPKKSLDISLDGINEGDFTMVYGFPGSTEQHLISDAVEYLVNTSNPLKIEMRETSLDVINEAMESDDQIRIQYAAKQSRISNAWKKWIGQNFGLIREKAIDKKRETEKQFKQDLQAELPLYNKYRNVLPELKEIQSKLNKYATARDLFIEYVFYGPEIIRFANRFEDLVNNYESMQEEGKLEDEVAKLKKITQSHFKNYNAIVDRKIFQALTHVYVKNLNSELLPDALTEFSGISAPSSLTSFTNNLYGKSLFTDESKITNLLDKISKGSIGKMRKDPGYKFMLSCYAAYFDNVRPSYDLLNSERNNKMRTYIAAQKLVYPDFNFWADANSTLRLTYGKAEGSSPRDGVTYMHYTTLGGIIDKYIPGDKEFDVPKKLIDLYNKRDYGRYGENGELHVCFTGSNHTSGGNSGSPCLNGEGQLIGLNFDRSWESTMSDVMFDEDLCRNIMVDVRYVLFIIDKFAGAGHLLNEMNLVQTKSLVPEINQ